MSRRKILSVVLALVLVCGLCTYGVGAVVTTVVVGDKALKFDVPPMVLDGTTFVPMRTIFEALGADITWNKHTRTVVAKKDKRQVRLTVGDSTAKVDDHVVFLDTPALIVRGRLLVPLRFVTQALGAEIRWDGTSKIIISETNTEKTGSEIKTGAASFTGQKLEAYNMLVGCKYSGVCEGDWHSLVKEVPFVGDNDVTEKTSTKGENTRLITKGMPGQYGGDVDKMLKVVPFKELVNSEKEDIAKFLQSADGVTVSEDTITITRANPPDSMLEVLNQANENIKWYYNKLDVSCKIHIKGDRVSSISNFYLKGKVLGKSGSWLPAEVWCTLTY
ncbi:MAG: copper amine oxidase N-terminal domain-containing protein [Candidatus Saccharibacteria bacterium]